MNKNQRNHKHITRAKFKRISVKRSRIKSKTDKKVSSTKIGKGSKLMKAIIAIKRMFKRGE